MATAEVTCKRCGESAAATGDIDPVDFMVSWVRTHDETCAA